MMRVGHAMLAPYGSLLAACQQDMGLKATERCGTQFAGTMSWSESGQDLVICEIAVFSKS